MVIKFSSSYSKVKVNLNLIIFGIIESVNFILKQGVEEISVNYNKNF
jgi:hypothetical protein